MGRVGVGEGFLVGSSCHIPRGCGRFDGEGGARNLRMPVMKLWINPGIRGVVSGIRKKYCVTFENVFDTQAEKLGMRGVVSGIRGVVSGISALAFVALTRRKVIRSREMVTIFLDLVIV